MSTRTSLAFKRLKKEYAAILKEPIDNCVIVPSEDDFLVWYVLLNLDSDAFKGAQIICQILFPKEYPYLPPDILVFTPNGRFETGRKICMSNSGFHREEWSYLWSLSSVVIGFISSFYEQQTGLGHLADDDDIRKMYASDSEAYNQRNHSDIMALFATFLSERQERE